MHAPLVGAGALAMQVPAMPEVVHVFVETAQLSKQRLSVVVAST